MHELEISEVNQIELYFKQRIKNKNISEKAKKLLIKELFDAFQQGIKFRRDGKINVKLDTKDIIV